MNTGDPLQDEIVGGLVLVLFSIWGVACLIRNLHRRTNRKLDRNHEHTHKKLDQIHGEVQSTHIRQDAAEKRDEHAHSKLNKIRRGFALIFRGDEAASKRFAEWWRSWFDK